MYSMAHDNIMLIYYPSLPYKQDNILIIKYKVNKIIH